MIASSFAARRAFSTGSQHVPIVIVGGGPSGLLLSNLLNIYDTPSLLLEARASDQLFRHPQAHFMNTRSMEILRHSLPHLYERSRNAMPPVEEWRYFSFGYAASGHHMARVVHPVDQPLDAKMDSNGLLLSENTVTTSPSPYPEHPLSVCSVGHLAQHTFSKLLYESAMESQIPQSKIALESPVANIEWIQDDQVYKLTTQSGNIVYSPIVIGADGSNSSIRRKWKIGCAGQEGIQYLVNVHVRASGLDLPPAMLYAIYNDDCVAMMVRHTEEEYVLQIPYFPPYQTVERNFTHVKVHKMMQKIMDTSTNLEILSIRPWTMSSWIAKSYVDAEVGGGAGALMGDAAHVFPPAGGFGMNTGLQDAHNLAWRLAHIHHQHGDSTTTIQQHLQQYQNDRQPIARNNAALSVRNFTRVLGLAKACYLNDQHPSLLIKMLDHLPLVPLEVKQDMFQGLLRAALSPLISLKDGTSWHAKHVTGKLRSILGQGGGLPLLFPKYELGFGYDGGDAKESGPSWTDDTLGYQPKIRAGYLMPHVSVEVLSNGSNYPNLQYIDNNTTVTTADLPSQMRRSEPHFVALVIGDYLDVEDLPFVPVARIITTDSSEVKGHENELLLLDKTSKLLSMTTGPCIVLIRPDSHVECIVENWDELRRSLSSKIGSTTRAKT